MLTVRMHKIIREWQSAKAKLQAADTLGGNVMKEEVENHLMNAGPVAFDFECSELFMSKNMRGRAGFFIFYCK